MKAASSELILELQGLGSWVTFVTCAGLIVSPEYHTVRAASTLGPPSLVHCDISANLLKPDELTSVQGERARYITCKSQVASFKYVELNMAP